MNSASRVASRSTRFARAHTCSAGGDEAVRGSALSTSGTVGGSKYSYRCAPSHSWDFRGCSDGASVVDAIAGSLESTSVNGAACGADGIKFDGVDDYVDIDDWEFGGTTSIEVLTKKSSYSNHARVFSFNSGEYDNIVALYSSGTTTDIVWNVYQGTATTTDVTKWTTTSVELETWTHFVLIASGNTLTIYKDGVLAATTTNGHEPLVMTRSNHWLGRTQAAWHDGGFAYFEGSIAYLKIWQGFELSAGAASALYEASYEISISTQEDLFNKIAHVGATALMASGGTLTLASGTYEAGLAHDDYVLFFFKSGLDANLMCEADNLGCIIDGSGTRQLMYISAGVLEFRGLVLSNGLFTDTNQWGYVYGGGGLSISNAAHVTLITCSIQNNVAPTKGGGIYVNSGATIVKLYGVSFMGNTSPDGPDIKRQDGSITVYSTCSASGDAADQGSALATSGSVGGSQNSYSCGFHWVSTQPDLYNQISTSGSSTMNNGDTVTLASGTYEAGSAHDSNSVFRPTGLHGNVRCTDDYLSCVLSGSGERRVVVVAGTSGGMLELRGLVVANGYAENDGGGLYIKDDAQVTLVMCRIKDNVWGGVGGGIIVYKSGSVVDLYGVSFSGNTSPDGPDINNFDYTANSWGLGTITVHSTCSAGEN